MDNKLIGEWEKESSESFDLLSRFVKNLDCKKDEVIDRKAKQFHLEVFDQIDCLACANCCKTTPAILTIQDIKRISRHLKISKKQFIHKYALQDINGEIVFRKVPCFFLLADNKCEIYKIRPEACSDYPHTDSQGFIKKNHLHIENIKLCPAVYHIIKKLKNVL